MQTDDGRRGLFPETEELLRLISRHYNLILTVGDDRRIGDGRPIG